MSASNRTVARRPLARRGLSLLLLLLLLLGFTRLSTRPAHAQCAHVHHWTAGSPPDVAQWTLYHQDGTIVSDANPAKRCEVVHVYIYRVRDVDACDVPNCPLNGTNEEDGYGNQGGAVRRWRDFGDDRGEGHFVTPTAQSWRWDLDDYIDPADQMLVGHGARTTYYRIPSTQPDRTIIYL